MSSGGTYHGRKRSVILDCLDQHPSATAKQIAEEIGSNPKVVSSRLSQLEKIGKVVRVSYSDPSDPRTRVAWAIKDQSDEERTTVAHNSPTPSMPARSAPTGAKHDADQLRDKIEQKLLSRLNEPDPPEWVLERIDRLMGIND